LTISWEIVALVEFTEGWFGWMRIMRNLMGGFLVAFSLFKSIDLTGTGDIFPTYDNLARRVKANGIVSRRGCMPFWLGKLAGSLVWKGRQSQGRMEVGLRSESID
jgi:hypothetical protein